MFFGGITQNKGVQVWKDVHAENPNLKLFGPDGVAETPFTSKLSASEQKATYITVPTLDPKLYPPPAEVLRGLQGEVRQGSGAVRDLRLRGHGSRPRRDQARGRQGQ